MTPHSAVGAGETWRCSHIP